MDIEYARILWTYISRNAYITRNVGIKMSFLMTSWVLCSLQIEISRYLR